MDNTRYSPKRDAILQCLRSTTCHPSAEWVYSQLKPTIPDLSLATVYRNLARFRAEGAVQVIGCVDGEDAATAAWPRRKPVDKCRCGGVKITNTTT